MQFNRTGSNLQRWTTNKAKERQRRTRTGGTVVEVLVNRTMKGTATRLGSKGGPYVLFRIAFLLFFVLASASQLRQTSGSCLALNKTNDALLSQLDPKCVPLLLSSSNSIFLPSSQTLENLLQQSLSFTRRLGVALPSSCRDASLRLSCHFVYKQCDEEEAVMVLSPCISVCEGMREECEEFFVATGNEDQLMACNTVLFPAPPICNNGSNEQLHVPYSQLDCPYPTVYRSTNEDDALQDPSQVCTLPCPGPIYTEEQWDIVFTIMTLFGGISLVLSCFYVATAFLNAETRKFPANLLPILAAATIPISVGLLFGLFAGGDMRNVLCSDDGTAYQGVGEGEAGGLACVLQGSLMAFGGLLVACWWSIIGLNLMLLIVFQLERSKLNKLVPWYHGVAWTIPLILTIIPLAAKKIAAAPTYPWCFIYDEDTDMWMYGCFYIWFIASWLFGSIMILVVLQYIYRRSYQFNTKGNMPLRHFIHLLMLLISFWVFTSFQIAYRFYGTGIKDDIQEAIEEQIRCSAETGTECELSEKPNYGLLVWCVFLVSNMGSVAFSTIGCTKSTLNFWKGLLTDMKNAKGSSHRLQVMKNYIKTRDHARFRAALASVAAREDLSRTPSISQSPRKLVEELGSSTSSSQPPDEEFDTFDVDQY
ncbi:hypothetical protein QOT17_006885 [Balamuthia mandrillaris]